MSSLRVSRRLALQNRRSFLLSSAAAANACRRRASNERVHMVLAGSGFSFHFLPHTIAQQLGLYQRDGLKVAIEIVPGGGAKGTQALLGGSADVVVGFHDDCVRMAAAGQAIRSFVTMTRYPGNLLFTSPQSSTRIQQIEDLKGSLIGVS